MKRILTWILMIVMTVCLLTGCSGDTQQGGESEKKQTYWVLESMTMEGVAFTEEEIESLFGPKESVLTLAMGEDGEASGVLFGEYFTASYTGSLESFELVIDGEKIQGACGEKGKMEITLQDGSSFVLTQQQEEPEALKKNPGFTYSPNFNAEETSAMSNFMVGGLYVVEDNMIYGLTHKDSKDGGLGATSFKMKGDFPEFGETKVLDDRGRALFVTKDGDTLYYIMGEEICRIKTDGTDFKVLYKGVCDYLQLHEGRLYFCDENYHLVSADLEGGDLKTVVDKEVYYPYFICSDWMVFQDDADNESLHIYNTTYGEEFNITYEPSYQPILDGKYLYYSTMSDGLTYISRADISDPSQILYESSENAIGDGCFLIDDKRIYTYNDTSVEKEKWKDLKYDEDVLEEREFYVSEGYTIYHELDADGLITYKYLMSKEKFGGSPFQ